MEEKGLIKGTQAAEKVINFSDRYSIHHHLMTQNDTNIYMGYDNVEKRPIMIKSMPTLRTPLQGGSMRFGYEQVHFSSNAPSSLTSQDLQTYQTLQGVATSGTYCQNILDIVEKDSTSFIIAQDVSMGDLNSYMTQTRFFQESDALLIFKQVLLGLKERHSRELVHGFINLENIYISVANLKLGDFVRENQLYYLAPQTLATGESQMHSDIWALGVLLYRLLYGVFPYSGTREEILIQIKNGSAKEQNPVFERNNGEQYYNRDMGGINENREPSKTFPILVSKETIFFINRMLEQEPSNRSRLDDLINNSLIEAIRLDQVVNNNNRSALNGIAFDLNEKARDKYLMFKATQRRIDYDVYLSEDSYFAFSVDLKAPVRIKVCDFIFNRVDKYFQKLNLFREINSILLNKVFELIPDQNIVFTITQYSNQGSLSEYMLKRKNIISPFFNESEVQETIQNMSGALNACYQKLPFHGTLHIKNVLVNDGQAKIGQPLLLSQKSEIMMREDHNINIKDFISPEMKKNSVEPSNTFLFERSDLWSAGYVYYRMCFAENPTFDPVSSRLIFPQSSNTYNFNPISDQLKNYIAACLLEDPLKRPDVQNVNGDLARSYFPDPWKIGTTTDSPSQIDNLSENNDQRKGSTISQAPSEQNEKSNAFKPNATGNSNLMKGVTLPPNFEELEVEDAEFQKRSRDNEMGNQRNDLDDSISNESSPIKRDRRQMLNQEEYMKLKKVDQTQVIDQESLIPYNYAGGEQMHQLKILIKIIGVVLLLMLVQVKNGKIKQILRTFHFFFTSWFREYFENACRLLINRSNYKSVYFNIYDQSGTTLSRFSVITLNSKFYEDSDISFDQITKRGNCFDNYFDPVEHPNRQLIKYIHSNAFFWWNFFSLLVMVVIIVVRCIHMVRTDFFTLLRNSQQPSLSPNNRYLMPMMVISSLQLSFLYYFHFQIFSFFYYVSMQPCLGMKAFNNVQMIFDSQKYFFNGEQTQFVKYIFFSIGIFFIWHLLSVIFFIWHPVKNSKHFISAGNIIFRLFSYIFGVWVVSRIGGILIFQPTFAYDDNHLIKNLFSEGDFMGVIGFIPQLFELILVAWDISVDLIIMVIDKKIQKKIEQNFFMPTANKRKRETNLELSTIQSRQQPSAILYPVSQLSFAKQM